MNFARFFVDRPIFAAVLSIIIFIAGGIALFQLGISEYPEVTPPSIVVSAQFPGATPQVISETVATPLEEQINGVENMLYMNSQATTDGKLSITITFKLGTNPDLAQQMVQNRVAQAEPRLPEEVRNIGVTTVKSSPDLTMVVHLLSPHGRYDTVYLRNYAVLNIRDQLARIPGIGQVLFFGGGDYAMRIWLNPQKLASLNVTATDVANAIREQNIQVAAGSIGGPPNENAAIELQLPINTQGRLQDVDDFKNIVLKTTPDGSVTRLGDVARIELGASEYGLRSLLNNKPAAAMPIFQMAGANAIQISDNVRKTMEELKKSFPEDMDYSIVYDPTVFVRDSIHAVIETLLEAITLVVIVVLIFLQTWRASIIPLIAVPISIIGTFAFMYMFGFSINALTLFGLVLAIGIVVDDAIVVVENVERNIHNGLAPREATYRAMQEVSSPIIATALTLCAVFVPIAFISGLTGQFYRQFALTIAISTVISAFGSLTLSPAMANLLLKSEDAPKDLPTRFINGIFGWFFEGFNRFFKAASKRYSRGVKFVLNQKLVMMIIFLILICTTFFLFQITPKGFIPSQDKQYLIAFAQLQDGATLDRSQKVIEEMTDISLKDPGVENAIAFPGLSVNGFTNSSSAGIIFLGLKPFGERKSADLSGPAITARLNQKYAAIDNAFIAVFPPPPVMGLGTLGGFKLEIEDRNDQGIQALNNVVQAVQMKAWQDPKLANVFSSYKINVPQLYADVDRVKAKQLGLSLTDVFDTMQIYLGSLYINDFNKFGRTYQVIAQADGPFRNHVEDALQLKARNAQGEMVPLGSVVKIKNSFGLESSTRYNAYRAADINGAPGMGVSTLDGQAEIVKILKEVMPKGFDYEWTDLTYQQILAGDTMFYVFPLCVFLVFLVLAAQYESLTLPLAVIMIVPMCLLCAIFGVKISGGDNNIFTQIGLIVLVGLACKNAILIVEFARDLEFQGFGIVEAAIEACRLRLRPILMTSFCFILGVVPLITSTGAGSEMRHAMGVAVFSGMLGVTFFGLFLTPVFYVLLRFATGSKKLEGHHTEGEIIRSHDDEEAIETDEDELHASR
jgi:multidrug efflux pump